MAEAPALSGDRSTADGDPGTGVASRSGTAAALWALTGVALLFGFAVFRLGRRGLSTIGEGLAPLEWGALLLGTLFMVYTEGVMTFQRHWVPRLVERARTLRTGGAAHHRLLAPMYGMSLIGATGKRTAIAWTASAAIVALVLFVRTLPDPWRGIVDFSVAAALAWGLALIVRGFARVTR